MGQATLGIDTNVGLHAKVPLIAFLGLMHLRIALLLFVLGRAGCLNDGGIHQSALGHHDACFGQPAIDGLEQLTGQLMLLEQVAEIHDGGAIRQGASQRDIMSHQLTFADSEFSTKRRQTRKEIFLSRMEQILPWQNMTAVIEPFYPKAGNGRRPYPLETMLRIHCMQHWYNLSDGAMEDALYEIASMRLFARLSLDSALPDRTTIMTPASTSQRLMVLNN